MTTPIRKSGDFSLNTPYENVQVRDLNASGAVSITGRKVTTGNITGQGNVEIKSIDPDTSPALLALIGGLRGGIKKHNEEIETPRKVTMPVINEQMETVDNLAGTIIRCKECGIYIKKFGGGKSFRNSQDSKMASSFEDPSGKSHTIMENGVFRIYDLGEGRYSIQRESDHKHF